MNGTERWSLQQYREYMSVAGGQVPKYRNNPCVVDGIRFDSQLEAAYYLYLQNERKEGRIAYYLRQVPFRLPGNVVYRVDFQVFWHYVDVERVQYVDVKGRETPTFKLKRKQVEELYPVKIDCIGRSEIPRSFINTVAEIVEIANGQL